MFKIKYKLSNPELLGLGIGAGTSIIGSYMTNKTNKEIAESNNRTMLQAMREQTASEQRYNSIGEQMKRAIAAGINPMLMAGAGASPTSASSSGVPSLDTPVMQNPFQGMESVGSSIVNSVLRNKEIGLQDESLDVSRLNSKIDLLKTISELAKNTELTTSDINGILRSVMDSDPESVNLSSLYRDQLVTTRILNGIRTSNVDADTKEYLFGWLDEMQNAVFTNLLADTELKQRQANVNRSLEALNYEKKKEIEQAILNMKEQWKSLNFHGELDASKLKELAKITDALVKQIVSEARVSEQEARFYLWSQINQTLAPILGGTGAMGLKLLGN